MTTLQKPAGSSEKWKQILSVEKALNEKFKCDHSLNRLGDKVGKPLPSFSTGLPTFDWEVIGTGGITKGRIFEFFGSESGGKTSICLHIAGQVQKAGGIVAFVDAEHSLDPTYAATLGVNVDDLVVSQPDTGEQGLETVDALVGIADLIIVDSVAALVPRAELEGEIGDSNVGLHARLMSQAMRILTGKVAKSGTAVIFINQVREKIGVMYGNPETTTGGRALKFFASCRIRVSRTEEIKKGGELLGHTIKLKAVKNKMNTPFRETLVDLLYGQGFDMGKDLVEQAIMTGIVRQSGAWFYFGDDKYQGKAPLLEEPVKSKIVEAVLKVQQTAQEAK